MDSVTHSRYALLPFFLAGVFFLVCAPLYWMQVESPGGRGVVRSHENLELYHRVCPSAGYVAGRLRAGNMPLWNDRQLCGTACLADPANGVFQPLNAAGLFLPPGAAMAVHSFMSLFLMGSLFLLFCRALGLGYTAGLAGGVVYAFSAVSGAAMSRPEIAATLAWSPLVYWAVAENTRSPRRAVAALGGVAFALVLFAGSPAAFSAMMLPALLYGLFGFRQENGVLPPRRGYRRPVPQAMLALMLLAGVVVSAVQWLPSLFWFWSLDAPWAAFWRLDLAGLPPRGWREALLHLSAPRPEMLPRMGYFGAAALVIVPAVLWHRRQRGNIVFFAVLAAAAMLLGGYGADWIGGGVPWEVCLLPASFAFAVLVALGADRLFEGRRDARTGRFWLPWLAALAVVAVLVFFAPVETKGRVLPIVVVLALFALVRRGWAGAAGSVAAALLLFVDLSTAGANHFQHPALGGGRMETMPDELVKPAAELALDGRVLVSAHPLNPVLSPNTGMETGLRSAGAAFLPLTPDQTRWWQALQTSREGDAVRAGRELSLIDRLLAPETAAAAKLDGFLDAAKNTSAGALANHMAVRAVLAAEDGGLAAGFDGGAGRPVLRRVRSSGGVTLFANDTALPRAHLVRWWRVAPEVMSAISVMGGDDFDAARECVVSPHGQGLNHLALALPDGRDVDGGRDRNKEAEKLPPPGTCAIVVDTPERVVVTAETDTPAILVLADTLAPGWHARVNGGGTVLLKVNGMFRGVVVPQGKSEVEFVYRPVAFYAGALVSLTALGVMFFSALRALWLLCRRGMEPSAA